MKKENEIIIKKYLEEMFNFNIYGNKIFNLENLLKKYDNLESFNYYRVFVKK